MHTTRSTTRLSRTRCRPTGTGTTASTAWRATAAGGRRSRGLLAGGVAGFLAAALAIGVANLAAAFVRPQASPIIAVGGAFIDRTPPALKNFAVAKFGENDKNMLLLGMYVTIALLAVFIGMIAWRHISVGVLGIGAVRGVRGVRRLHATGEPGHRRDPVDGRRDRRDHRHRGAGSLGEPERHRWTTRAAYYGPRHRAAGAGMGRMMRTDLPETEATAPRAAPRQPAQVPGRGRPDRGGGRRGRVRRPVPAGQAVLGEHLRGQDRAGQGAAAPGRARRSPISRGCRRSTRRTTSSTGWTRPWSSRRCRRRRGSCGSTAWSITR